MIDGFLGIDLGTQGLTVILVDQQGTLLAEAGGEYSMLEGLPAGCYEQDPLDWERALVQATKSLLQKLKQQNLDARILAIGIAGQMHGEVMADDRGLPLGSARLWCDSRNEQEGHELTELFQVKIPKRMTVARWLWTIRNQPEKARQVAHLTTPAGWLAWRLTGEWNLGIGDASGMFPIDPVKLDFDQQALQAFQQFSEMGKVRPLPDLLPKVRRVGEEGGVLSEQGAQWLGLNPGIPVAPVEGDQPASLVGSLVGSSGSVAISFGTSVCANSVGDRPFRGISHSIDHFCGVDGKPINMVFLRNGTTFMNALVGMFDVCQEQGQSNVFDRVMPAVMMAPNDCGGVIALPFMDDEPGLNINRGGQASLIGLSGENARMGNVVKAGLLATLFNLRLGMELLEQQGYPRHEIVLSGGLTKTPELAQILADVLNTPVSLMPDAAEGCAWGGALMAIYRFQSLQADQPTDWIDFLNRFRPEATRKFHPQPDSVASYQAVYGQYCKLLETLQR